MTLGPRLSKTERALQARLQDRSSARPCDETRCSVFAAAEKKLEEPGVLADRTQRPGRRLILAGSFGAAVMLTAGVAWLAAQSGTTGSRDAGQPRVDEMAAPPKPLQAENGPGLLVEVDARLAETRAGLARVQGVATLAPADARPSVSRLLKRAQRLRAALGENGNSV